MKWRTQDADNTMQFAMHPKKKSEVQVPLGLFLLDRSVREHEGVLFIRIRIKGKGKRTEAVFVHLTNWIFSCSSNICFSGYQLVLGPGSSIFWPDNTGPATLEFGLTESSPPVSEIFHFLLDRRATGFVHFCQSPQPVSQSSM
jgi:hypothetical protein